MAVVNSTTVGIISYIAAAVLTCVLLIIGLAVLCFSLYLYFVVHRKYNHIPGPPRASFFLGHLPVFGRYDKEGKIFADAVTDWMNEYGTVVAVYVLHRVLVMTCSPAAVKEFVVSTKHPKNYELYTGFGYPYGARLMGRGLVTELDTSVWARKRAVCDSAFHRKALRKYMDQFNASGDLLVEQLSKMADGKTEVNLLDEVNRITLDAIAKVAFGLDLNLLGDEENVFNKAVMTVFSGIQYSTRNPLSKFSPSAFMRQKRQEVADACSLLRETGRECVRDRLAAKSRGEPLRDDVLTLMIEGTDRFDNCDAHDGGEVDMVHILDEFVTIFGAGQETTANTLAFLFLEICQSEEIMHRLRTEVEAVVSDTDVQFEELAKLSYTSSVIKETLRKYPPAPGTARDTVCDTVIDGVAIPKGSCVQILTYVASRLEKYFKDPLVFDPDRFNRKNEIIPHTYYPFMVGPRSCIGQQFAMIEAKVLIAKLLKKFNFDLVPGQSLHIVHHVTIKPKDRCKVYMTLRDA